MGKLPLRLWQQEAMPLWEKEGHKGIVGVVTGGGKTIFALSCIEKLAPDTSLVVVPSAALLDQWWEESASYFDLDLDEINIITGHQRMKKGTINIAVLNTASKLQVDGRSRPSFLIVDECHKAASAQFRTALDVPTVATLGLSATPERQYDHGLAEVLIPALGPIIYRYTYKEALADGVIVPFKLQNVVFELEEDRQKEYDKVTKAIARSIDQNGSEAQETVRLFLKRSRIMNLSLTRVHLALKIVAAHRTKKVIVFHEDIEACNLIHQILVQNGVKAGNYHSKLSLRERVEVVSAYRRGDLNVLVTCRALDEGFNVPETEIGIIAASTATRRQRIQRLGRILRPASGKDGAEIFTLVATNPEVHRLKAEELELEGVAEVTWSKA